MTWLQRIRPAIYVLGAVLLVATLLGARALTGNGHAADAKSNNPASEAPKSVGLTVWANVDSATPPIDYRLPPVLQSGTIAKVFVKDGQEVKAGDELYSFDTTIQSCDVERAKIAVKTAKNEVANANEAKKLHDAQIKAIEATLEAAERSVKSATTRYNLQKSSLEKSFKAQGIEPKEWPQQLSDSPELFKANMDYADALSARDKIQSELNIAKARDMELLVKKAQIAVEQAEAEQNKAQMVLDLCTVKARTAGTIEQMKISPGATLGISTRDPALWLIPAGPRVVRAEVEAEFAHRVHNDLVGKEVTIRDATDEKLTYKGIVRRIGTTFLPKRSGEGLLSNDTRALEVVVEVADPAPPGKPSLHVGQRVRVNLGQ